MIKFEGGKVIEIDREAEEVSIPPTATRICENACIYCSITSLDIENAQITIIEKQAFANCKNLGEVRFPSSLEEICELAFTKCQNLKNISFPSDSRLRKIGDSAFARCIKLEPFRFPPLLEFIGSGSFSYTNEISEFDLRKTKICHIGRNMVSYFHQKIYLPPTVDIASIVGNNSMPLIIESHPIVKRDDCGYYIIRNGIFGGMNRPKTSVLIRRGVDRIENGCFFESSLVSLTIPSSVTEICSLAFFECESLRYVKFSKDSRLNSIQDYAFCRCCSIKKIQFPKSLKIIKDGAFESCKSLECVVFPQDSQLERIEGAFEETIIKRLSLPPSVREIVGVSFRMENLESMFVSNEYYQSNEEGSAIFSKDGSELVCVIKTLKKIEIPDSVRVIKKRAFYESSITGPIIPPSVEVIKEEAFNDCDYLIIKFQEGSRLKSLAFDAFCKLEDLIINNENFVKMENGVIMSMNPMGIVFVPRRLTELEIPPGVEVIYSYAFNKSSIRRLKLPKSLKKICSWAFYDSSLESVTFEEGTELDFIGNHAFYNSNVKILKLPSIKGDLDENSLYFRADVIEFPRNMNLKNVDLDSWPNKIICPRSSLSVMAHIDLIYETPILQIIDS